MARSSGLVSWALATAAILWGLALSTRLFPKRPKAGWLQDLHRYLGTLALTFTGIHMAALVADSYVEFRIGDLLIPFASQWRPVAVAWGVIAFYLLLAVQITSALKRKIRPRTWRVVHRLSFGIFALGTLHAATAGTDATGAIAVWVGAICLGAVTFSALLRVLSPRSSLNKA